ncbi:MAG TPA: NAD kinase, partial [Halieaceae bacterium]|nr:NAD kinase [Halieaceae bacterium]
MPAAFKTIGLLGRSHDEEFTQLLVDLLQLLHERGYEVIV